MKRHAELLEPEPSSLQVTEDITTVLQQHSVDTTGTLNDLTASSAVALLSTDDGTSIHVAVLCWIYTPSKRFFTREHNGVSEHFILVNYNNKVQALSLGITVFQETYYDNFTFTERFPEHSKCLLQHQGHPTYCVEIAACVSTRPLHSLDTKDATHILNKYNQRLRNLKKYYSHKHDQRHSFYKVQQSCDAAADRVREQQWTSGNALEDLQAATHPWDVTGYTPDDVARAILQDTEYVCDNVSVTKVLPSPNTNIHGCLLRDICHQSSSSASIPHTRLFVPWVTHHRGKVTLVMKVVV